MREENVFRQLRHELDSEKKEYTATLLSEKLGLSVRVISGVENDAVASLSTLEAYHKFFNVPFEYLLGYKGSTRHYENISIGKATGLTDEAIKKLREISSNRPIYIDALSAIIETPQFNYLMACIAGYPIVGENETVNSNRLAAVRMKEEDLHLISAQNTLAEIMREMKITCPQRMGYRRYFETWCSDIADAVAGVGGDFSKFSDSISYIEQFGIDFAKYYQMHKQEAMKHGEKESC